jgi:hypothetical protein
MKKFRQGIGLPYVPALEPNKKLRHWRAYLAF